ncbi:MAG TPA: chemotaxis protein CheB, partial [Kofleriaceae bacterium]|nr:chemotaxis protein CheB [Kofleriaceae bacterium]
MLDTGFRIVVIGGDGPRDFERVLNDLPAKSALAVIVHAPESPFRAERAPAMPFEVVRHSTKLEPGKIFVVPADQHALIRDRSIALQSTRAT